MATKEKKAAPKKAKAQVKPAAKKAKAPAAKKAVTVASPELEGLDRKGLAAKARLIKKELLAIRFNPQAPSLKDFRNKKKELAMVLAKLG